MPTLHNQERMISFLIFLCRKEVKQMNYNKETELIRGSQIITRDVEWLWYPYIPYGKITIIQGVPGEGKSTFALNLVAMLTQGITPPFTDGEIEPMNVIYQNTEDDAEDTVIPRFINAGGDTDRIFFIDEKEAALTFSDAERIENAIKACNAKLIIFDPLTSYIGGDVAINQTNEVRSRFNYLIDVAKKTKCAIVIVSHMNYMQPQGFYRSMETLQIIRKSFLGSMPIQMIEKEHLHRFLRSITTYADSTIEKIFLQLKRAFQMALSKKIVDTNLMLDDEIVRPRSKKETKKIVSFTQEEQRIFLETLHEHKVPAFRNNYKRQILLELNTGMRMREINALKKDDIDFRRKVIKVKRTISLGEKSIPFLNDKTKTDAGRREIPFTDETEKLLREIIKDSKANPEGLLFYDYIKMGLITTNQVNSFFNRLCEKAGLDIRGQHSLRHTFATRCIEAGIEAVVLKKWMGHTDIHVTLDTYADIFDSLHNSSINKLGDHMTTIAQ